MKKQVKSLYHQALTEVSKRIWRFTKQHRSSSCGPCGSPAHARECSVILREKERLALPHDIIQDVFLQIQTYLIAKWSKHSYGNRNDLFFIITNLLHIPEIQITDFTMIKDEDKYFVRKFEKNIQTLHFAQNEFICDKRDNWNNYSLPVLFSASTIHTISLNYVTLSDDTLKPIGQGCVQLKVLDCLEVNENITSQLFDGLCFREVNGVRVRNSCCDTLQKIGVRSFKCDVIGRNYYRISRSLIQNMMNHFARFLFENLPNLKSLGDTFKVDQYLQFVGSNEIPQTALEDVTVTYLTPVLRIFCPNLRHLNVGNSSKGIFRNLQLFEQLENLKVTIDRKYSSDSEFLYKEIICCQFQNLKSFQYANINGSRLNLSVLAKYMPSLETLSFEHSIGTVEWNGKTHFKDLKNFDVCMGEIDNISWARSFSQTICEIYIQIYPNNDFPIPHNLLSTCDVFQNIPFPELQILCLPRFEYDFEWITSIVNNCPKLKEFEITELGKVETKELSEFARENNLDISFE